MTVLNMYGCTYVSVYISTNAHHFFSVLNINNARKITVIVQNIYKHICMYNVVISANITLTHQFAIYMHNYN